MPRLPIPGSDDGAWGTILNDFLSVELNADGSLKRASDIATAQSTANAKYAKPGSGIPTADLAADSVTSSRVDSTIRTSLGKADSAIQTVNSKSGSSITLATSDLADSTDKRFVTDAEKTKLANTTGTNSGDQTLSIIGSSLTISGSNGNSITLPTGSGGTGVAGPGTSVNGHLAVFSGTGGDAIADSGKTAPTGAIVGASDTQTLTNKTLTGGLVTADPTAPLGIASKQYVDARATGTNTGDQTITLTGDVTGTGTGSFAATLASVATPGTVGSASLIPVITFDAKGRITSASSVSPSITPGDSVIVSVADSGAVGDGTTNDLPAIQAAIDAAPDGSVIYFPSGNYRVNGTISIVDRELTLRGVAGTCILQGASGTTLKATSNAVWIEDVSAVTTTLVESTSVDSQNTLVTRLTLSNPRFTRQGDIVKLFSSDVIPSSKPSTGGQARRMGESALVMTPTHETVAANGTTPSTTVTLSHVLYEEDMYATDIKLALYSKRKLRIEGIHFKTVGEPSVGAWNTGNQAFLHIEGYFQPELINLGATGLLQTFIRLVGTYQAHLNGGYSCDLRNQPQYNRYGYHVDDKAEYTLMQNVTAINNRHVYTTNTDTALTAAIDENSFWSFGRTKYALIQGCVSHGASNSGFDTHDEAYSITFQNCKAIGSYRGNSGSGSGFSIRGRRISIKGCQTTRCRFGVQLYEEFDGSTQDILIADSEFLESTVFGIGSNQSTSGSSTADIIDRVTIRNVECTVVTNSPSRAVAAFSLYGMTATMEGTCKGTISGVIDSDSYGVYIGQSDKSNNGGSLTVNGRLTLDLSNQVETLSDTVYGIWIEDGCSLTSLMPRRQGIRVQAGSATNMGALFAGSGTGTVSVSGVSTDLASPSYTSGVTVLKSGWEGDAATTSSTRYRSQTVTSGAVTLNISGVQDESFLVALTLSGSAGQAFVLSSALPAGSFRGQRMEIAVIAAPNGECFVIPHSSGLSSYTPSQQNLVLGLDTLVAATFDGSRWRFENVTSQADVITVSGATTLSATQRSFVMLSGTGSYTLTLPDATVMHGGEITIHKGSSGGTVTLATQGSQTINGSSSMPLFDGSAQSMILYSNGVNWYVASKTPLSQTVSTAVTIGSNADLVYVSGTVTITLPTSARRNRSLTLIKTDSGTTTTIDGNGSETIDGLASVAMTTQYSTLRLISDGAGVWYVESAKAGAVSATL